MSVKFLRATCVAASVLAATAVANDRLEDEAKRLFHVTDATVLELDLPAQAGTPALVSVELEGMPFTLDIKPFAPRTLGYRVYEDAGSGLVEHPAGEINTFRGEVLEDPGSVVAGSLLPEGFYAVVQLSSGDKYWIEPMAPKSANADLDDHVVYHQDDVIPLGGSCGGARLVDEIDAFTSDGADPAGLIVEVGDLGVDADFQYFQDYGSVAGTENRINLVINTMNVQYTTEVGIRHDISVLIVRTTNGGGGYTSSDANTLLDQFQAEWTSNQAGQPRDIAHLFTGKNMNGGTIGIAYLGVICNFGFGYGLVESNFSGQNLAASTDLSAHELGHNWDADHCNCSNPDYTMNPFITVANRFHPNATIPDIVAHRNSRNCLDEEVNGTILYIDDFESGNWTAGGWTISNSARCKVKAPASYTGNYGAKLKKGGVGTVACTVGTDETWAYTPSFSTAGHSSATILMHAHFRNNTLGCEFMDVQYSVSGGAWTSFGAEVQNHPWAEYSFALPAAAVGQGNVRIRLITNAKGQAERAEIDNFCVVGN